MSKNISKDTICVRGGYTPKVGEPLALPIVQSTTYSYDDPDLVADLFDLKAPGHLYTRISNPTCEALEQKLAQLEGGVGAVSVASGQSAILLAILNICSSGDHIIASSSLYGGTYNLLNSTLRKQGIEVTFVTNDKTKEDILELVRPNTKLLYGETIGNPGLDIFDFEKYSNVGKKAGIPLVIDNTIASPCLCNPFEHGANIIIHSTSKYIDGHGVALGGAIIDGGNFDWESGRFPQLVEPDPSYHGIKYVETFKEAAYITKLRVTLLRDLGSVLSPFNAFLTNLTLETLPLRIKKHSENALDVAKFLENHEKVASVSYPYLESQSDYDKAKKYLKGGGSGILTFSIKGGLNEAKELIKSLEVINLAVHLGLSKTSILHPASTTHRQLSEEEQIKCGVSPTLIRLSVGLENVEYIISDLKNALEK